MKRDSIIFTNMKLFDAMDSLQEIGVVGALASVVLITIGGYVKGRHCRALNGTGNVNGIADVVENLYKYFTDDNSEVIEIKKRHENEEDNHERD